MSIPSIDPGDVGLTGLLWLFLSYGYVLYVASNLIAEGSDLLLLVPSVAGLVGSIILPILGAVPDGAIMLFSGLGDIETAQETLSVGVGALAGSTIMLLTVPWALSVVAGRVDINPATGNTCYSDKPKLDPDAGLVQTLFETGVSLTDEIRHGAVIMMATTVPYFLIQVPATFLHGPTETVAKGEHYYALAGLVVCLAGFGLYLYLQVRISQRGEDKLRRIAVMKKLLSQGRVSLSGALSDLIKMQERKTARAAGAGGLVSGGTRISSYQALQEPPIDREADNNNNNNGGGGGRPGIQPPGDIRTYLEGVLKEAFIKYDKDRNDSLDKKEVKIFFKDFHEDIDDKETDALFAKYDTDGDGTINFKEFVGMCYCIVLCQMDKDEDGNDSRDGDGDEDENGADEAGKIERTFSVGIIRGLSAEDDEEEDAPGELSDMPPEKQQAAIVRRSLTMLLGGTILVLLFSDPMVEVLSEMAARAGVSPFYVSFLLAPLAANASEVIASRYYAAKKTRKTITVSLTALEGAAAMNNTFCLSIFMGLIYFRGLAWQYTAETVTILLVEFAIGVFVQKKKMTTFEGLIALCVFPLSLVLVAVLESFGLD